MTKETLRKEMTQMMNDMDPMYKREQENILHTKMLNYIKTHDFKSVGVVLSMPFELDTDPLIESLTDRGIEVYNPVCDYDDKEMDFHPFTSFDDVSLDEKGIRAPKMTTKNNDLELIIVPGLVFSREGYRIGHGGGFFDRFLADFDNDTVSIIFDEQLGEVDGEPHDVPVKMLITPTETIKTDND